jgi:HEAT repeat protein
MKSSRQWVAPLIAVLVVGTGAGVLWLGGALRSHKTDPAPEVVEIDEEAFDTDLAGQEVRAKKLPEYADLAGPPKPEPPYTDQQITRFLELADHPNKSIRINALVRLSWVTGPRRDEAIDRIVRGLKDPSPVVRLVAIDMLGQSGARDRIPELIPFLNGTFRSEREAAKRALKQLGHPMEE